MKGLMRRREFLSLPATVFVERPTGGAAEVRLLRAAGAGVWAALEEVWGGREVARVVARGPAAWWPNGVEPPNGFTAWIEDGRGTALVVECAGRAAAPAAGDVAEAVWAALTGAPGAGV